MSINSPVNQPSGAISTSPSSSFIAPRPTRHQTPIYPSIFTYNSPPQSLIFEQPISTTSTSSNMFSSKTLFLATLAYLATPTLAAPKPLPNTAAQYGDGPRDDYHCDGVTAQKKNLYAQQGTTLGNSTALIDHLPLLTSGLSHRLRYCHSGKVTLQSISASLYQ